MNTAERIKKLRLAQGLSTYDVSKKTGLSQSVISRVENGKRKLDDEILNKLAEAFGVSVDRLTGDSASSIIENRLEETGMSIEELSKASDVPLSWLENLDSFIPGDMEFLCQDTPTDRQDIPADEQDYEIDWEDIITDGNVRSYAWITRVAKVLGIRPSILRLALARQEIPLSDGDCNPTSAAQAFSIPEPQTHKASAENRLLSSFRKLNDTGKEKAVDYVEDLGDNPKYSAATATPPASEPDHLTVIAAHNDHATEPGQLELMRQDAEMIKKMAAEKRKK